MEGLIRVAAAVPHLHLGNAAANTQAHLQKMQQAAEAHAALVLFPELSLTGYTCGDLFFQHRLLDESNSALMELADCCPDDLVCVVGAPLTRPEGIYNCAVVISHGQIHGAVPKGFLPNNSEFYEKRWFRSGFDLPEGGITYQLGKYSFPLTMRQIFTDKKGVSFGIEICEDLWTPIPPSTLATLAGAQIVLNLSASNELISKREYRHHLILQQSARCLCGYVYASAGYGESSSDLVFSGHSLAACSGSMIRESDGYLADDYLMTADIDIDRINADRARQTSFGDAYAQFGVPFTYVNLPFGLSLPDEVTPDMHVSRHPFIPTDRTSRDTRCRQIFDLQSVALARRLQVTGGKLVVGISGGLDSTLALLAACHAVDLLGLPRTNILGVTMPCFGTTDRTHQNAVQLMTLLGVSQREVSIHAAVRQHFADIGHDENDHSVTYENCQARERTQVLMDIANQIGGIVLGTGDLSEIALGWCTYNADHMSMYGVNSGVPKTLVRWVVQTASDMPAFSNARAVLLDILDTPISPELLPPDESGKITQQTEDLVGPYELHDFFLYYAIRFGYEPKKIFELCCDAFNGQYDHKTILKWLKNFYRRFWTQQFKRNCMPDGVKIGSISLSPRGDWRMPSDAQVSTWLQACDALDQ